MYEVVDGVAICAKPVQLAPWHRSRRYPVTPTLSVAAVQVSVIWLVEFAVAVNPDGAVGGVVSPPPPLPDVVAPAEAE